MISVIVPIYNEEKYLEACVRSIAEQDFPKEELEVIFADGMSTDRSREILSELSLRHPYMRVVDNPQRTVSYALNAGIRAAKGDIIIRLDAHSVFPKNYFSTLVQYLERLHADNVGGVCRTLPANNTSKCRGIAAVMQHPFGMGNSYFRIGAHEIREVDTVPFGCFRRDLFEKIGYFDTCLIRNQDDEFNGRIIKNGGRIFLLPQLVIDYYARRTIKDTGRMFYQYGLFKPLVNKKLGKAATLRQFVPLLFVIGLFLGAVLSLFCHPVAYAYSAVLALYLLVSAAVSLQVAIREDCPEMFFWMPSSFFVVHFWYGFGYLIGLFKLLFHSRFDVKSSRR